MPSVCRSIKQEYESLKTLNAEFVSACEKAGDVRVLSSLQLRELQILQRALEQKRDEFVEKTANARWKKVWKELMLMEIDVADHKERVDEILSGIDFQNHLTGSIISTAQKALTSAFFGSFYEISAVNGINAAVKFGHLSEVNCQSMQHSVNFEALHEKVENALASVIKTDPRDVDVVVVVARGVAAFGQRYVDERREGVVRAWMEKESTRKRIFEHITKNLEMGQNISRERSMDAVIGFHTALSLELLKDREIEHIQQLMRNKDFLDHLVEGIVSYIQTELAGDGETAAFVLQTVNAIKALTMLRRPEKK